MELEARQVLGRLGKDHDVFISLSAYIELQGRVGPAVAGAVDEPEVWPSYDIAMEASTTLGVSPPDFGLAEWFPEPEPAPDGDAVSLLLSMDEVVLLGEAGAGKSTVAREVSTGWPGR
jgi:hypothetical protein